MTEKILVEIPEELIQISGLSQEDINKKNLEIWVFELYADGKVSLSKASQLLNLKIDKFLKEFYKKRLKRAGSPVTIDEAIHDETVASEFTKRKSK